MAATTAALSFVVQAPALEVKRAFFRTVVEQGRRPFTPLQALDESTHEAKLAFRLVPPLLVDTLRLSVEQYYALQAVLGVATLLGLALLFHRVGYSRRNAALLVLGLSLTYMGAVWFVDTQPYFDALAASALILAMCVPHPAAVFIGGSIAMWTDERSVLPLGIVALFHLYRSRRDGAAAIGVVIVAYAALRVALGQRYGLTTGSSEIGPAVFFRYWTAMPLAVLLSLEGLLVVLVAGYGAAVRSRQWLVVAAGALTAGTLGVAVMVNDVTRSTVYALPGVVFALAYLADLSDRVRRPAFIGLALCVFPTTAAIVTSGAVLDHISFFYPLPVRLFL